MQKSEFGWKLRNAASNGDIDVVRVELEVGTPIDCVSNMDGRSALHNAATTGQLDVVQLLLQKGASLELVDSTGNTALHLAIASGNAQCVSVLLRHGSDAFAHKNQKGKTAYVLAQEMQGSVFDAFSQVYNMGGDAQNGASAPKWVRDDTVSSCQSCDIAFTFVKRRHHCRACGEIFCKKCSGHSVPLPHFGISAAVRVCDACLAALTVPSGEGDTNGDRGSK